MKAKNIFAGVSIASILLIASTPAFAQQTSSATAQANATVVTPIEITAATALNFGNLAVNASGGTVEIDVSSGAMDRQGHGGVSLPSTSGTTSAAAFTVTGQANYQFTITINPSSVTLNSGTNTMTAGTFQSFPASPGMLSASGTKTVLVGGILTVGGSQPIGTYTSATPVTVTVSYQ